MNNMSPKIKIMPIDGTKDWVVKESFEATMQTPFKDMKGTKTIFPKGAFVKGRKVKEVMLKGDKVISERESLQAPDKNGFYIIPFSNVVEADETESQPIAEKTADDAVKVVEQAYKQAKGLNWEKYTGFSFKQLVVITLIGVVVVKTLK